MQWKDNCFSHTGHCGITVMEWILGILGSSYSSALHDSRTIGRKYRSASLLSKTIIVSQCRHAWLSFSDVCNLCVYTVCPEERAPCGSIYEQTEWGMCTLRRYKVIFPPRQNRECKIKHYGAKKIGNLLVFQKWKLTSSPKNFLLF